ncbi:hypothetical protein ACS5PM_00865 [Ideonella sp. YS5]
MFVFIASVFSALTREVKDLNAHRAEAAEQFKLWLASNGAYQLGLNPESSEVVQESETYGQERDGVIYSYTLTRFLRTSKGHYVMFKSSPKKPYVKLVEPAVAKIVLKEKYVPLADG